MAKIEASGATKYTQAQKMLGNERTILNQGLESMLKDPTVEHLNVVGHPDHAVVVVAKMKGLTDDHKRYSISQPLPYEASQEIVLETYSHVFSDKLPGLPANGKTPPMVTTELSPTEGEWGNPVNFVEAALANGYTCTNENGLMTSPAAQIAIEHKPADEETQSREVTTLAIANRQPNKMTINTSHGEISCNVADMESLELSLDGDQFAILKQYLEEKGIEWVISDEGFVTSYATNVDFATLIASVARDVKKDIAPQAKIEIDEVQTRMVATKI